MLEEAFDMTPMKYTFVIYTIGMILIGLVAYLSTKNLSDYILGGRKMGTVVTALSAGASDMSGWLLMGLPGAVFAAGLSQSWIAIGLCVGAWLNWYFLSGRLRVHTEVCNDSLTIPEYLTQRFQDPSRIISIVSAVIILVFFTIYCASGIVAGARLFETTFALPYHTAIWYGAIATIVYVFIGGYLAVSWTDTVQATLMIFALLLLPVFCFLAIGKVGDTGLNSMQVLQSIEASRWNLFEGMSAIGIISLMAWGLGYFGQPHILARFMAADSAKTMKNARRVGMIWMVLCLGGAVAAGFLGFAFFSQIPSWNSAQTVFANKELVFLEATKILFNPWIAGIVLSAVLAAVMSTLSCQLLVCSSTLTEDLYKGLLRPKAGQKELVWFGRIMVLTIALIAIALAQDPHSGILSLVSYAWAGFGAAFGPVILLSVLWKRMTRRGAIAGMVVGAATIFLWTTPFGEASLASITGLYEIIPGFILALVAIVITSINDKEPSIEMREKFDRAEKMYQDAIK